MKKYHVSQRHGIDWFITYAEDREAFAEQTRMGTVPVVTFDTHSEAAKYVATQRIAYVITRRAFQL